MKVTSTLLAATLVLGCAELGAMMALQQGMAKEFHHAAIGININNSSMMITFANAPADSLPEVEKAAYARRVAEYVRDHYPHYRSLKSLDVRFATMTTTGGVKFTQSSTPYHFTPADLGPVSS